MRLLRSINAIDESGLKNILSVLAQSLGAKTPNISFTEFIKKVSDFEQRYTFWDKCNEAFEKLDQANFLISKDLKNKQYVKVYLKEIIYQK